MIEPAVDAYGGYARASALADYLELLALQERSLTREELADLIEDNGWRARLQELFRSPHDAAIEFDEIEEADLAEEEEIEIEEEPALLAATRAFDVLAERADALADAYPFEIGPRLEARAERAGESELYLALLALTVAHAYTIECPHDPTRVFEDSVAATLASLGLLAVNLGEVARRSASFPEAIIAAGATIELAPTPDAATYRIRAQDERVDALAHFWLRDGRPGQWTFIGQATCAKSEDWPRKLSEPAPAAWRLYLNTLIEPTPFLAVPHHIESRNFYYLMERDQRMVLDRPRLCRRSTLLDSEREMLDCVLAADVWRP